MKKIYLLIIGILGLISMSASAQNGQRIQMQSNENVINDYRGGTSQRFLQIRPRMNAPIFPNYPDIGEIWMDSTNFYLWYHNGQGYKRVADTLLVQNKINTLQSWSSGQFLSKSDTDDLMQKSVANAAISSMSADINSKLSASDTMGLSYRINNISLTPGPQGEVGPVGPKGDTGDPGVNGSQGLKGDKGDTGEKGETGNVGPQGEIGPAGAQGPQGIQGITGAKGDKGDQGVQGIAGNTGATGSVGPQGPAGENVNFTAGSNISITGSAPNYTISSTTTGATGTYGLVTVSNGLVTGGKRVETYSGTTNASGVYTVTFSTPYSVAPNIQASITNQSSANQQIRVTSVSTTGFTVNVFQRNAVTLLSIEVLLAAVANVNGATVDVLVTEK